MEIQQIKTVVFFENLLCVYRNAAAHGKLMIFGIAVRVILEIAIIIYNADLHIRYQNKSDHHMEGLFFFTSATNSFLIILISFWYSKSFLRLSKYLNHNHVLLKHNEKYTRKLKKAQCSCIFAMTMIFSIYILVFVVFRYVRHFEMYVGIVTQYLLDIHLTICDHRFIFEYIALYTMLTVIAEQLYSTMQFVDDVEKNMLEGLRDGHVDYREHIKVFDKLCIIYTNIKEVSKLFNTIFGIQITAMLGSIVFYFIIFLYSMTSLSVKGELSFLHMFFYMCTTLMLLLTLGVLSRSAQRTQNLAAAFRRRLSKLLIASLECPTEDLYKATKDVIRLVVTRPIRIEAFGSINVDMTLIPKCVLFFTYYVVIALQFNNVV